MEFTSTLILDSLKYGYPEVETTDYLSSEVYHSLELYYPGLNLKPGTLYIAYSSQVAELKDLSPDVGLVVIGKPHKGIVCRDCLFLPSEVLAEKLFSALSSVLKEYDAWEKALLTLASSGRSVKEMLDISVDILKNPITTFDISGELASVSEGLSDLEAEGFTVEMNSKRYLSIKRTQAFDIDELLYELKKKKHSFSYAIGDEENALISPIRRDDILRGFILIPQIRGAMADYHALAADYLARVIAMTARNDDLRGSREMGQLEAVIIKLMHGSSANQNYVEKLLKQRSWNLDDKYALAVIKGKDEGYPFKEKVRTFRFMLERLFPYALLIELDESCVLIQNTVLIKDLDEAARAIVQLFLARNSLVCGVSYTFYNFMDLESFYLQAEVSADGIAAADSSVGLAAAAHSSTYPLGFYESYFAWHLIKDFALSHEALHFVHPDILRLFNTDKAKGSNLVLTLYTYLVNDRSYSKTAEKMHVHKSTLNYRLDKILSMSNEDLLDPEQRLNILYSIKTLLTLDSELGIQD